jgi:AcrR family transcriptional regulator
VALFARRGFAGTSTRALAAAAGISEAMLFKHFSGKGALYRAILARKIEESERAMPLRALEASADPPGRFLGRVADFLLRRVESDPAFLRLLLYSALEGHPLARAFDRARAAGVRRVVAGYLRREGERGRLRRLDAAIAARAFLGGVAWLALSRVLFREPGIRRVPRGRLVREVVSIHLEGLRRRGRAS